MDTTAYLVEQNFALRKKNAEMAATLRQIAQYDPRWTGQRVNDMPNRAKLIEWAYEALLVDVDV